MKEKTYAESWEIAVACFFLCTFVLCLVWGVYQRIVMLETHLGIKMNDAGKYVQIETEKPAK